MFGLVIRLSDLMDLCFSTSSNINNQACHVNVNILERPIYKRYQIQNGPLFWNSIKSAFTSSQFSEPDRLKYHILRALNYPTKSVSFACQTHVKLQKWASLLHLRRWRRNSFQKHQIFRGNHTSKDGLINSEGKWPKYYCIGLVLKKSIWVRKVK